MEDTQSFVPGANKDCNGEATATLLDGKNEAEGTGHCKRELTARESEKLSDENGIACSRPTQPLE
jgi:hypothetical protein